MSIITRHVPGFIDVEHSPKFARFEDEDELLAVEWIAVFAAEPDFHRFSLWRLETIPEVRTPDEIRIYLMAEYDGGHRWFVVGRIDGPAPDLPTWKPGGQ